MILSLALGAKILEECVVKFKPKCQLPFKNTAACAFPSLPFPLLPTWPPAPAPQGPAWPASGCGYQQDHHCHSGKLGHTSHQLCSPYIVYNLRPLQFLVNNWGNKCLPMLDFLHSVLKSSQQRFFGQLLSAKQQGREKFHPGEEVFLIAQDLQGTEVGPESVRLN